MSGLSHASVQCSLSFRQGKHTIRASDLAGGKCQLLSCEDIEEGKERGRLCVPLLFLEETESEKGGNKYKVNKWKNTIKVN